MKQNHYRIPIAAIVILLAGCSSKYREDLDYGYSVEQVLSLDEFLSQPMVQFESVRWDADDTAELRSMITNENSAAGRKVLEIGTGTGVIAILCLLHGADQVVATDVNPAAVANANYNAAAIELDSNLDVRQVDTGSAGTFAKIGNGERFGLIIVNPSIELDNVSDPSSTVDTFLDRLPYHLLPGGRCIVACHQGQRINRWKLGSESRRYELTLLGDRQFESTEDNLFPARLLEIRVPAERLSETMAPSKAE